MLAGAFGVKLVFQGVDELGKIDQLKLDVPVKAE